MTQRSWCKKNKQGGWRFTLPPGAEIKTEKERKLNKEKKKKKSPKHQESEAMVTLAEEIIEREERVNTERLV